MSLAERQAIVALMFLVMFVVGAGAAALIPPQWRKGNYRRVALLAYACFVLCNPAVLSMYWLATGQKLFER